MENMDILTKLEEYSKADYVPMHMPGGKRNTEYASTSVLDITEIDGFDNMHNAEGIIKMHPAGQQNCMEQIKH